MNRSDYLASLRSYLNGRIPSSEVESNIDYYSAYIEGEVAKGRTEEEVTEELGDPQIIARTLIDSVKRRNGEDPAEKVKYSEDFSENNAGNGYAGGYTNGGYAGSENRSESSSGYSYSTRGEQNTSGTGKRSRAGWWIFGAVMLLFFVVIIAIMVFTFRLGIVVISRFWPVLLVLLAVWLIVGATRRRI